MRVVSVISTKGSVSKTTVTANLGLIADAGLRVLLLDLDSQPTLSIYYALSHMAICAAPDWAAAWELLAEQLATTREHCSPRLIFQRRPPNLMRL